MSPAGQISGTVVVTDVSKRYGEMYALKSVSLEIAQKECVALLGSNGAGKTTLLKIIATHIVPSSGTVTISGEDISGKEGSLRRKIGLVTHDSFLYDELTVQENLQFYVQFFCENKEKIPFDLVEFLGLEHWYNTPVKHLSYGLRKRADIGRAFIHNPDVILLDEPFAGLDAASCDRLVQHFEEQKEAGKMLMLSSHSKEWLHKVCDRDVVLNKGRIITEQPPGEKDHHEC